MPGLLDIVAARTKISTAVVSPFKGMALAPGVREASCAPKRRPTWSPAAWP